MQSQTKNIYMTITIVPIPISMQPINDFIVNCSCKNTKAKTPILWPSHEKSWLITKDLDAGRDWGQEEKGTTEDKMASGGKLNGTMEEVKTRVISEVEKVLLDKWMVF